MAEVEYFLSLVSPWAYLGHRAFLDLAGRHGLKIRYRPMTLAKVFANSGALPLAERPKARQDYRMVELQRWREKRGIALNLRPKHFPTNPALADRSLIALALRGGDPGRYAEAVMRACWAEERDIAEPEVLAACLRSSGLEPHPILAAAAEPAAEAEYAANTEEAVRRNVIGSPTYVLNGEMFWGQDRLDLLGAAIESGREPYRVPG